MLGLGLGSVGSQAVPGFWGGGLKSQKASRADVRLGFRVGLRV